MSEYLKSKKWLHCQINVAMFPFKTLFFIYLRQSSVTFNPLHCHKPLITLLRILRMIWRCSNWYFEVKSHPVLSWLPLSAGSIGSHMETKCESLKMNNNVTPHRVILNLRGTGVWNSYSVTSIIIFLNWKLDAFHTDLQDAGGRRVVFDSHPSVGGNLDKKEKKKNVNDSSMLEAVTPNRLKPSKFTWMQKQQVVSLCSLWRYTHASGAVCMSAVFLNNK